MNAVTSPEKLYADVQDIYKPHAIEDQADILETYGVFGMTTLMEATTSTNKVLENLLSKANDFDQLKSELTAFIEDRKKFIEALPDEEWCIDTPANFEKHVWWLRHTSEEASRKFLFQNPT